MVKNNLISFHNHFNLPFQTCSFLPLKMQRLSKLIIFYSHLWCYQCSWKNTNRWGKSQKCIDFGALPNIDLFFFSLFLLYHVFFFIVPCVFNEHDVLTLSFPYFIDNSIMLPKNVTHLWPWATTLKVREACSPKPPL